MYPTALRNMAAGWQLLALLGIKNRHSYRSPLVILPHYGPSHTYLFIKFQILKPLNQSLSIIYLKIGLVTTTWTFLKWNDSGALCALSWHETPDFLLNKYPNYCGYVTIHHRQPIDQHPVVVVHIAHINTKKKQNYCQTALRILNYSLKIIELSFLI